MTTEKTTKEILGGPNGTARCRCGRLRYPRYSLCPKCYYERSEPSPNPKKLSRADLLKMQATKPMPLSDRQERIQFLEKRYGAQLRGQDIRFIKTSESKTPALIRGIQTRPCELDHSVM